MRRAVKALLESQDGWVVCGEAANGLEAIEKTEKLQPDVLVMDMIMPHLNGLEATRRIHREFPDSHILILTLHDVPELTRLVQTAGRPGVGIEIGLEPAADLGRRASGPQRHLLFVQKLRFPHQRGA